MGQCDRMGTGTRVCLPENRLEPLTAGVLAFPQTQLTFPVLQLLPCQTLILYSSSQVPKHSEGQDR